MTEPYLNTKPLDEFDDFSPRMINCINYYIYTAIEPINAEEDTPRAILTR